MSAADVPCASSMQVESGDVGRAILPCGLHRSQVLGQMIPRILVAIVIAVMLAGCIAIDSGVKSEQPVADSAAMVSGTFSCTASYTSRKAGLLGPSIETIFDGPQCDTITLAPSGDDALDAMLEKDGSVIHTTSLTKKDGLSRDTDAFLFRVRMCGSEELQIGCILYTFTLFANQQGDLVLIQSGGGGGLLAIFPVFVYGKLMSVFPRVPDEVH